MAGPGGDSRGREKRDSGHANISDMEQRGNMQRKTLIQQMQVIKRGENVMLNYFQEIKK